MSSIITPCKAIRAMNVSVTKLGLLTQNLWNGLEDTPKEVALTTRFKRVVLTSLKKDSSKETAPTEATAHLTYSIGKVMDIKTAYCKHMTIEFCRRYQK